MRKVKVTSNLIILCVFCGSHPPQYNLLFFVRVISKYIFIMRSVLKSLPVFINAELSADKKTDIFLMKVRVGEKNTKL